MPTIHVTPFPPETPWQEFEKITRDGIALKWDSPTLQGEGRPGQGQDGVDIFGPDFLGRPVAIQCKKYKDPLKLAVVKKEVGYAEKFKAGGSLNCLYIATTAPRDAKLQREVRILSEERIKQGKFAVGLLFWDDIFTGLLLEHNILISHFPSLKFPAASSPEEKKATRIAAMTLGYYGQFIWHFVELMFSEFGWMAGQDPEDARTLLRIVRSSAKIAPTQVCSELRDWTERVETELFSSEKKDWDLIKTLLLRVENRVKYLSPMLNDVTDGDFTELGIHIGALYWSEGLLKQTTADELSRKICTLLPSASISVPEALTRFIGKEGHNAAPVLFTISERELRWPTTQEVV